MTKSTIVTKMLIKTFRKHEINDMNEEKEVKKRIEMDVF